MAIDCDYTPWTMVEHIAKNNYITNFDVRCNIKDYEMIKHNYQQIFKNLMICENECCKITIDLKTKDADPVYTKEWELYNLTKQPWTPQNAPLIIYKIWVEEPRWEYKTNIFHEELQQNYDDEGTAIQKFFRKRSRRGGKRHNKNKK